MTIWHSPAEVPRDLGPTAVTIGVFDGVHRGHREVVGRAAEHARALGVPAVAITFDPHPMVVIRPEVAPPLLLPVGGRAELLKQAGADHVLVLLFGRERSEQSAEDFVAEIVVDLLHARAVVVGSDFRFGHRAAGDVPLLERLGKEHGFVVELLDSMGNAIVPRWSSTHIRERLLVGDVATAATALGRPFRVGGVVVRGHGRGRAMGFPTANVPPPEGQVVPADGVYAGWLTRVPDGERWPAAISVGTNPTFGGVERTVEAYALDRDDLELYGVPVAVEFVERIRGQVKFDSVDALVMRMRRDVEETHALLGV
ncbi:MAG: bifunctional riboflavin kinase/FAD synthetase [Jiangellaceae bacterium]|nr:bifunctional riboflavin kinase/FAD synthetase [Jiangellaceae bacterium]